MRRVFLITVFVYLLAGIFFHAGWERAQSRCREQKHRMGEFVEPPVFSFPISLIFDITMWPIYSMANLYHSGKIFATACDQDRDF